jgi:hypothetical protein
MDMAEPTSLRRDSVASLVYHGTWKEVGTTGKDHYWERIQYDGSIRSRDRVAIRRRFSGAKGEAEAQGSGDQGLTEVVWMTKSGGIAVESRPSRRRGKVGELRVESWRDGEMTGRRHV